MSQLIDLFRSVDVKPTTFLDIGLTALLIYGLFSLIRDTRAVRLVIGVTVLYAVYVAAQLLGLQLLSQILQAGAVVGLFAVVVVFQPELRRALERLGRVGSLGWLLAPSAQGAAERMAAEIARASAGLAADRHGALILIERETGLEDTAETGVMIHADLSAELLRTVFMPRSPLHDGAVIVRGETVLAAGAVIERLSETAPHSHRYGTRHRAALGISEETDALAVVVSEESGAISLVEGGRIVRNLDEDKLRVALITLLRLGGSHRPIAAPFAVRRRRISRSTLGLHRPRSLRRGPRDGQSSATPATAATPAVVPGGTAATSGQGERARG
jgi:diadenylate cyclase